MTQSLCATDGCDRTGQMRRGMCDTHYRQVLRRGDFAPLPSIEDRLSTHLIRTSSGCLEWTGYTNPKGYGQIQAGGRLRLTHRLAWELVHGPIPEGMFVCHHCDNPPCAQTEPTEGYPEGHLFLGTNDENMADMVAKGRGHGRYHGWDADLAAAFDTGTGEVR
jgi:HNH endonuclease